MAKPQTIEIFLPNGNPKEIKIAKLRNRTIVATYFARSDFEELKKREITKQVGVYILVGISDETERQEVYIGEAENCFERLLQHNAKKDFWNYAIIINSDNAEFNKAHVKYLEWLLWSKANEANRCSIVNGSAPTKSYINEGQEYDLLDNFETIKVLVSTLGLNIFERIDREKAEEERGDIFECKDSMGHWGEGEYVGGEFVLFKGARCRKDIVKSMNNEKLSEYRKRELLISEKILVLKVDYYELIQNYRFSSSSLACTMILGRGQNGWFNWKRKSDGKTLDEVYRKKAN